MLRVPAATVYIDPEVRRRAHCMARLERMLPNIDCDDVREYDAAAREAFANISRRRHGKDRFGDEAVILFTTMEPGREGWYYHYRDASKEGSTHGGFCQSALELNLVDGCVFRCAYCGFGRAIRFSLDVEGYMAGLDGVFARHPQQRLYKFSNMTDLPPFEPELDAVAPMVRRFAAEPDRYLMLFTKSDNVDFLLPLDHNGHTIVSWSLTCETASRLIDRRAPALDERIEAMHKCQQAGYLVRARLSPIVPIRGWRGEYEALFTRLFAAVKPDVVTLELLGWFGFEDLPRLIDPELLDPELYAEAAASVGELGDVGWRPFTDRAHQEVYRHCIETAFRISPGTPVTVCHGTQSVWAALGEKIGMTPASYLCNCGPTSAPGDPLYNACAGRA
ncbi:MAG: hypothetical protein BIFFINMI_01678 [Phycisphaerae bacterium]|nr:hypothetical protein [Phycisphaerae bacterium]